MIKFLLMCLLMVFSVNASEMEWIEEEVVGKRLALVRCMGNQPENFVRDDLEELRRDVRHLLACKSTLAVSLAGDLCGVDDGAIARIEEIFGKYERVGKSWQPLFMNSLRGFNYYRNKLVDGKFEDMKIIECNLKVKIASMECAASNFERLLSDASRKSYF